MEEILQKAEELLEQEKADVIYLEQILGNLRFLKGRSHQDTFADQNVF